MFEHGYSQYKSPASALAWKGRVHVDWQLPSQFSNAGAEHGYVQKGRPCTYLLMSGGTQAGRHVPFQYRYLLIGHINAQKLRMIGLPSAFTVSGDGHEAEHVPSQ